MQFGQARAQIGITFIGADNEPARFGHGEIGPGHAGVGAKEVWPRRLALGFRKIIHVLIASLGAKRSCENSRNVASQLMYRRDNNMTWRLVIKLLNALA